MNQSIVETVLKNAAMVLVSASIVMPVATKVYLIKKGFLKKDT